MTVNEVLRVHAPPTHKNVYVALAAAQMEMDPLTKGALNPAFKGEGKPKGTAYADLADVVQAVRHALNTHGLTYFHQMICGDRDVMRTALVHGESETRIECDVPLIVAKNDMQGMKSATTYAKRIGLESVTGVAPEDDDGNAAVASAPTKINMIEADVAQAIRDIAREQSLADLGAMFGDLYRNKRAVADDPRVVKAKDIRKAELQRAADLLGDEVPY